MKLILLLFTTLLSCSSEPRKDNNVKENPLTDSLNKITCFLLTVDGEREVYRIEADKLYSNGKSSKIDNEILEKIEKVPSKLKENNQKFGCGVCMDAIDFKFVFEFQNDTRVLEIQPRYKDVPKDIEEYTKILIDLYNKQLQNPK